jgi:methyl-accepting chemotaxis protein
MTVVGRVRGGYAILAALLLITAALYVVKYIAIDRPNAADRVTEQRLTTVSQAVPTSAALYSAWIDKGLLYGGMISGDPAVLTDASNRARQALAAMTGRVKGPPRRLLEQLTSSCSQFLAVAQSTFALEQAGDMSKARILAASKVNGLTEEVLTANDEFRQSVTAALSASRRGRDALGTTINVVLVIVFASTALVGVVMVVRIPRDIAAMVRGAIGDLETTTSQVSAVSVQLASSAAQAASAVSEAAATIEEVRQTSLLANQKSSAQSEKAREAGRFAEAGRTALADIVADIDGIRDQVDVVGASIVRLSEQTEAIAAITSTSSDIAEQSNLLAVNAAIEAAKSAQEGTGFAVVAEEIRSLALQSRGAVQQVRNVLADILGATTAAADAAEQSSGAIGRSIARVARSSEAIETLAESVEMSVQSSLQIATSSQQQMVGMDQIGQAMGSIDAASAQNAAAAQEMVDEMARLQAVAGRLRSMIGTPVLSDEEAEQVRAAFAASVMGSEDQNEAVGTDERAPAPASTPAS